MSMRVRGSYELHYYSQSSFQFLFKLRKRAARLSGNAGTGQRSLLGPTVSTRILHRNRRGSWPTCHRQHPGHHLLRLACFPMLLLLLRMLVAQPQTCAWMLVAWRLHLSPPADASDGRPSELPRLSPTRAGSCSSPSPIRQRLCAKSSHRSLDGRGEH